MQIVRDPHSFARASEAVVEHIDLDLTVDFGRRTLSGHALLSFKKSGDTNKLILDTSHLNIDRITGEQLLTLIEPLN